MDTDVDSEVDTDADVDNDVDGHLADDSGIVFEGDETLARRARQRTKPFLMSLLVKFGGRKAR